MKHYLIPIVLILSITTSQATIRTVSNDPNRPAQFATIQAAINAATSGDTIYVNGSSTAYNESVVVNKRLVLLGAGYNSANQLNLSTVLFNGLTLSNDNSGNNSSGTVIAGFRIPSISVANIQPVDDIQIFRNQINTSITVYGDSWSIVNNIIGLDITTLSGIATNVLIQNNIISRSVVSFVQPSVIIDHNLFLRSSGASIQSTRFATITNNIFAGPTASAFVIAANSNTFNNNLTNSSVVSDVAPTNSFAGGPNSASGNIVGTDPQFVSAANLTTYNAIFNYRLQNSSAGKNAGTDGTDIGIYGGTSPFPSGGAPGSGYDTSAPPPIPQVTTLNIQNPSLVPGAQLKVTIQATVNN